MIKPKLVVILGPTASGKSSLAVDLAKKYNGYIISADSRQIYKETNISTAKITKQEKKGVKHFMLDISDPKKSFSVAEFKKQVLEIIQENSNQLPFPPRQSLPKGTLTRSLQPSRQSPLRRDSAVTGNKIPFLVGGTGLYISAIVDNLQIPEVKPNFKLRTKLDEKNIHELLEQLKKLDPKIIKIIDKKNKRKIIRALEYCLTTKNKFSQAQKTGKPLFDVLQIGIETSRKKLYQKINLRVDQMIKQGLVDEVKKLSKKYGWDTTAMSGIGTKQIGMCLCNEISLEDAIELIKRDTRHYAKRQMTWFKRDQRINWVENKNQAEKLIINFL